MKMYILRTKFLPMDIYVMLSSVSTYLTNRSGMAETTLKDNSMIFMLNKVIRLLGYY